MALQTPVGTTEYATGTSSQWAPADAAAAEGSTLSPGGASPDSSRLTEMGQNSSDLLLLLEGFVPFLSHGDLRLKQSKTKTQSNTSDFSRLTLKWKETSKNFSQKWNIVPENIFIV